ncbi:XF1762 family protein [Hyphomonas sp.]|uniref:XF1762 family protein n=1 Tax=Hyphomonas sp. TaxID=87 RepID=UPI0025C711DF|nr:XF1762 family protein [Hyphomonas sp.]
MKLKTVPMSIQEANEFVANFHRHSKPTQGGKFAIGASCDGLFGVAIVGRPIARRLDDGFTAEVLRVCVNPNAPKNTCSFLYGRCWRIWQQMGGMKMITYTLQSESGSSLRGVGWKIMGETGGWNENKGWTTRPNRDWLPIYGQLKFRWEKT